MAVQLPFGLLDTVDYKHRVFTTSYFVGKDPARGPGWYVWGRDKDGTIKVICEPNGKPRWHPHYNIYVNSGWKRKKDAIQVMGQVEEFVKAQGL